MTNDSEQNQYAAPKADLEADYDDSQGLHLASRWARLGGAMIDSIISLVIMLPIMFLTIGFDIFFAGQQPSVVYNLILAAVGIVVFLVLHGYLLVNYGQTIGKRLLNIKIVTLDDKQPMISELCKRYAVYLLVQFVPVLGAILSLINILFIFGAQKRCLHDLAGNTKVVIC